MDYMSCENMFPYQIRKNKIIFICSVLSVSVVILISHAITSRDAAIKKLEQRLLQVEQSGVRQHLTASPNQVSGYGTDDNTLLIYNRVPKTGSTSFAGIAYELCYRNKYHVLHVNTTNNVHTLSVRDQMHFIENITQWREKRPAMYHGHFYYIDFARLGYTTERPVFVNIIRKPLDRLLSYYYFVRFGDNFRPHLIRRKQGNQMTFDECVEQDHRDCDPVHLWLQIPFFCGHSYRCRQPGSRWALEQAKFNLVHNYLLVGVTEELGDFIAMLEMMLPRFFSGAMDLYMNGEKSHLRQTNKKDMPSKETIAKIQQSTIWKMENEFYEFALDQFHFLKKLTFTLADDQTRQDSSTANSKTFLLSDGQLYVPKPVQFMYEKVRPR